MKKRLYVIIAVTAAVILAAAYFGRQEIMLSGLEDCANDEATVGEGKFKLENLTGGLALLKLDKEYGVYKISLNRCKCYKKTGGKFYIISDCGYALINIDEGNCKTYMTVTPEEFGTVYDLEGNPHYSDIIYDEDEDMEYLETFEEFSEDEQKIFNKMKKQENSKFSLKQKLAEAVEKSLEEPFGRTKYAKIGKDDRVIMGDGKFKIAHAPNRNDLEAYDDEYEIYSVIMLYCQNYKKVKGNYYVISEYGYAVIYTESGICKIYPTVSEEQFETVYSDGKEYHMDTIAERDDVIYLSSFEEFSEDEQKIFEKLTEVG